MSVRERRGRFMVEVYDPAVGKKRYVASYATREEAEQAETELTRFKPRKCVGCGERFRPKGARQERCNPSCGAERLPNVDGRNWVYRCFRTDGRLLYVGITVPGMRRFKEHAADQPWWIEVDYIRVQHCESREDALEAEAKAIQLEQPLHNRRGIGAQRPRKVVRMAEYRDAAS